MRRESDSGDEAVGRRPNTEARDRSDEDDWIASFRDVHFDWNEPGQGREPPGSSDDEWFLSPGPAPPPRIDPDDRARPVSEPATGDVGAFEDTRAPKRSRKRVAVVAAAVVLVLVGAVVAAGAVIERDDGGKSSSSGSGTVTSHRSTTTSRPAVSTTITTAAAPPTAVPTPGPFTVRSTCGGRACTVAVHEGSTTAAAAAGSLRDGEVVQVSCSTHGESVADRDTGQRSDVWYRLADRGGYASALYLEGPAVPDCG